MKKNLQLTGILAANLAFGLLCFTACKKDSSNTNDESNTEMSLAA